MAYGAVHRYAFLDIDDGLYVYDNPHVTGPLNWIQIKWAFTHSYGANYAPVDFLAHSLDVRIFRLNSGYHHIVNLTLHLICILLLFLVLRSATGCSGRSLMVAGLFALHPINVENVAWISEQKTMISTIFFLLALAAYQWFASRPRLSRMLVVSMLYGIGLLVKPQIITFPFVLLLWDWWPLNRVEDIGANNKGPGALRFPQRTIRQLLLEKTPLYVITAFAIAVTLYAERFMQKVLILPFYIRLGNAILSYGRFLEKAVWPANLALMYLHPGYGLSWPLVSLSLSVIVGITVLVFYSKCKRYLTVGWLWFFGTMVPTIGFVQVDLHALADRYAYLAFIGLFLMFCWGISDWAEQNPISRWMLPWVGGLILCVLAGRTHYQVTFWSDRFALWNHTLDITHHNWAADYRLGNAYIALGQPERALTYFYQAAEDVPSQPVVNLQIGLLEHQRGNLRQAIDAYQKAITYSKDPAINAQALANMGHAYGDLGDYDKARQCFQQAVRYTTRPDVPPRD
jgi:protein O-mannosyl-transferase